MTSSRVQTSSTLLLAIALSAPLAFADQKDDQYKKGTDAINAGDSVAASNAFCALPADFKDAGAQCAQYKPLAEKRLNQYKFNYSNGTQAMQSGDYSTAEIEFKKVKYGDYADEAKKQLGLIPGLKQKAMDAANAANANAAAEGQMKAKLDAGNNAWSSGDFNAAKAALGGIAGSHKSEADALLAKIKNYEGKIVEAQSYALNKQYTQAAAAFGEAVRMNPSGPGDPLGQVGKMNQLAAQASSTPANASSNPPPVVKPPTPVKQIDVNAYLADAQKALAKKDYKKARRFLGDIFAQDRNNQEAKDILASVNGADTVAAKASDEDTLLLDIVKTYYAGSYQDAEDRLKVYIYNNQGKKKGLANFYLGASMLTRYYLAGGSDQNLRREAQNKFKAAKEVDGFKAPDKFISPKIMKVFEEAS